MPTKGLQFAPLAGHPFIADRSDHQLSKTILRPVPEWSSALGLLIASFVPAGLAAWRFKYQRAKRRKILDSAYPQLLILGESGIETQERGGKVLFAEWGYYSGFRQGKSAFFLKMAGKRKYRTIPFDTLQLEQQGQMRAIILNHLPEIQES